MEITTLTAQHTNLLYDLYVCQTQAIPHCRFAPDYMAFADALLAQGDGQQALVAMEDGAARGFAVLRAHIEKSDWNDGVQRAGITALFFDAPEAGQALLAHCEALAHESGAGELQVFSATHRNCPIPGYNAGWDGLSDRLPEVARALAQAGYTPYYRQLMLELDFARFPPQQSPAPADIMLKMSDGTYGRRLSALSDDREIGVCIYTTLAHLPHPGAAHQGYIQALGVDETFRRRGIARYLLTIALLELQAQGCDNCWLTTEGVNWPAQPLYLSLGFEIVDSSVSFYKRFATIAQK